MTVELERESLRRVGVELVNALVRVLRCRTCGCTWAPLSARDDGRLPDSWWKCPNDPRHTREPEDSAAQSPS